MYKRIIITFLFVLAGQYLFAQVNIISEQDSIEKKEMEYDFSLAEGAKNKMLGNNDKAIEFFARCLELNPNSPTPYYELSAIHYVNGEVEIARGYAEQAIQLDPSNQWFKFLAIEIASGQERFLDGAKYYGQLYEQFSDNEEYLSGEIDMLMMAGDYKNALKRVEQLESKFGYSKYTAIRKKDIYLSTGKEKLAYKELEKMIEEFPEEVEIMGILAELYAENGEEEKALNLFQKMKEMNSGNPLVYFSLGKYYMDLGRKADAISEFKTGFESKDVNPEIKIQVFLELIRVQSPDEQLNSNMAELLEVMYKTDQGYSGVDVLYADYLYNQGEMDSAEVIYKRIVDNNPSNPLAWQNLLLIQSTQQDFREMFDIAGEAISNYPNLPFFLLFQGIGASQIQEYSVAIESLKSGLSMNMNNPELTKQFYISLGDTYYQVGEHDKAFKNFDKLLALEPDNDLVLNNYSYYLAVLDRDIDKALEMIEKCISKNPDNATYLDTYAWVLYRNGDLKDALKAIEKAISLNENPSGEVLEHYGDILFMNNRVEEAREKWKLAKEAGGASEEIDNKIERGLKEG